MNRFLFSIVIASGFFFIFSHTANGQKKMNRKDSIRQEKIRQGKMIFSQVVLPASAPETGFLIGSASAFTFSTRPGDTTIHRSAVPVIAYVSVRGSYGLQSNAVLYFNRKIRWLNYIEFNHLVDNYWGVGYEAGSTIEQGEQTTQYTRNNFKWNPRVSKEIKKHLYAGLQLDMNYTHVLETNPVMEQDGAYIQYGDLVKTAGAGLILQYDSRDMIVNAWKGILLEISYLNYPSSWSAGNGYSILSFDYRQFKAIGSRGKILAWNIRSRFGSGDIPYTQLSTTGSGKDLRGYYDGRYRDQSSASSMIEYRHTFKKGDGLSKHGFVVWTGAGQIFNEDQSMDINHTLPSAGLGYRFSLQPRINIRIDAGFGKNSNALYINITEAF